MQVYGKPKSNGIRILVSYQERFKTTPVDCLRQHQESKNVEGGFPQYTELKSLKNSNHTPSPSRAKADRSLGNK